MFLLDDDDDTDVVWCKGVGVGEYLFGNVGGATFCILSSSSLSSHGLLRLVIKRLGASSSPRDIEYNKLAVILLGTV